MLFKLAKIIAGLFFLISYVSIAFANSYEIKKVNYEVLPGSTKVFVEVSSQVGYIATKLVSDLTPSSHPKLKVVFYPANLTFSQKEIKLKKNKFIQQIRLNQETPNSVNVILDLTNKEYTYNIYPDGPSRMVIDLKSPGKDIIADLLRGESSPLIPKKKKIPRIILDPGHGGEDPGAIGPSGLKEKDINLKVAEELAKLLRKKLGVEVYLTREKDQFVSLDRRAELANQWKGDLFISIHTNAGFNKVAHGVETFFNSKYPYGEGATAVAERENKQISISDNISPEAKMILWDMLQTRYRKKSNELAHIIQKRLSETTGLDDRGTKSAGFYVLRGVAMPAILVEIGFISNPLEERKLKTESFRKKIVQGIFEGIKDYMERVVE